MVNETFHRFPKGTAGPCVPGRDSLLAKWAKARLGAAA